MQTQNTMTAALVSAGFPAMPHIKRVWLWLHDHPGKTASEVASAIGADVHTTSAYMATLVKRKMVTRTRSTRRTVRGLRTPYEYKTCIREYELLPLPAKNKASNQASNASSASTSEMTARAIRGALGDAAKRPIQSQIEATTKIAIDHTQNHQTIDVKQLPLGEALRLYGELKVVFGERA